MSGIKRKIRRNQMPHKLIIGDDKLRANKCLQEVNQVLQRYDCVIMPQIAFRGPKMEFGWFVQAIPRDGKEKNA